MSELATMYSIALQTELYTLSVFFYSIWHSLSFSGSFNLSPSLYLSIALPLTLLYSLVLSLSLSLSLEPGLPLVRLTRCWSPLQPCGFGFLRWT